MTNNATKESWGKICLRFILLLILSGSAIFVIFYNDGLTSVESVTAAKKGEESQIRRLKSELNDLKNLAQLKVQ